MGDTELLKELKSTKQLSRRNRYNIPLMVTGAVATAFVIVVIALNLYDSSGTAQLDLSRPGYQAVRNQAGKNVEVEAFSATGGLSVEVFEQFDQLYSEQVKSMVKLDAFGGDVLSDKALGLPIVKDVN